MNPKPIHVRQIACPRCDMVFPSWDELVKHKDSHPKITEIKPTTKVEEPIGLPPVIPIIPVKTPNLPKPILLKYTYEGNCTCGKEVETIPLESGKYTTVVAWCSICKKNIHQRKVNKL